MNTDNVLSQNSQNTESSKVSRHSIGKNLSFSASEAFKSLRTNLTYSFADYEGCRIIGVTSTDRFEGKSTTSINLAYSLMESGGKVLLIECDLRLPSFSQTLKIPSAPGLSNLLINSSKNRLSTLICYNNTNLFFLPAGDIPPNPSELLASKAMNELINYYSTIFEYIILDLPPTLAVTDAPIVSKYTNGIIFVVRHKITDRLRLRDSMYQLSLVGARILGFVYNCSPRMDSKYKTRYARDYIKKQEQK
ncbi:MAG: CpsD/CapB family tyrosine-protein kinase [Bacillota bacterium]|nr:CpsD/CapB family tyrosine-protein kinase [Bacillota bacterium]